MIARSTLGFLRGSARYGVTRVTIPLGLLADLYDEFAPFMFPVQADGSRPRLSFAQFRAEIEGGEVFLYGVRLVPGWIA